MCTTGTTEARRAGALSMARTALLLDDDQPSDRRARPLAGRHGIDEPTPMSQMTDPSDWRDALPGPTEELYEAVGRLRHALRAITVATGDSLVEASAREWVITVLREEAANELGEEWMWDAEHDHRPRHG